MLDLASHFSSFLNADLARLHFAAHSHHPWPDVTRAAQMQCWEDAAKLIDGKWDHVLGNILPQAQRHIAQRLALPDEKSIVFAPNTHELLMRLLSCLPASRPLRILTSDSEFHSFTRQIARLEEDGLVQVQRIAAMPFASFSARFAEAAKQGFDLIYVSQVFFNSGFAVGDFADLAAASGDAMLVVDGYHGFMARPTDWSPYADRAFYIAGGYKYAMAGEGVCFMYCPPGWGARPRDTGWYAAFGALSAAQPGQVPYAGDGWRFMGATFDPSGLYRFNAVQDWLQREAVDVTTIHAHVQALQERFVASLPAGPLASSQLVVPAGLPRGNFLTFELENADEVQRRLAAAKVVTDHRGARLRIGFGIYHTFDVVDALLDRLRNL
ncbi:aminotransferase class V-fold PLP-dependent enzyme [uncultured Ferrovibrio sp.]|uniref:aminotransferase class V-fold PLP-dependent enzyme n=1 Tax=uncultured Ferrovibrio sp. TaxID=1576913 RepID=UPI002614A4D0|nr:aminotransferase class V-fold PLP-dependent enzyme [uncultured Ferrovibrio sp.]